MSDEFVEQVTGVSALAEPARRALYLYVSTQADAVSREQAASAVDLPLHSVKFHLDRLVDEGLLEVEFRRLSGRTGPGAGRPAKLYRRAARQFAVTLPERRYELAGDVLATAVTRAMREALPVEDAVRDAATAEGLRIATAHSRGTGDTACAQESARFDERGRPDELTTVATVLAEHGYEPRARDQEICLANCPFDRLATKHTELVCAMNLALIGGVIDGLGLRHLRAALEPQQGYCCVKVRR